MKPAQSNNREPIATKHNKRINKLPLLLLSLVVVNSCRNLSASVPPMSQKEQNKPSAIDHTPASRTCYGIAPDGGGGAGVRHETT
jgi:hypothetical protein